MKLSFELCSTGILIHGMWDFNTWDVMVSRLYFPATCCACVDYFILAASDIAHPF